MKPQKLLKLLVEAETRVSHLEKSLSPVNDEVGLKDSVVSRLVDLRMRLRRYQSKIDVLQLHDVESLERVVGILREDLIEGMRTTRPAAPIWKALRTIYDDTTLQQFTGGLRIGLIQLEPDELIERVPGQKTAAFKFEFIENELTVIDQPLRLEENEQAIALAAFEAAVEQGEIVRNDLGVTNASPRLKEAFDRLQSTMASYKNIVQVGARAQMCSRLVQAEAEELSPNLFGLLVGHVESVFSALAQFRDWREYCENASRVPLDRQSIDDLTRGAAAIIAQIRLSETADSAVADALATVAGWVEEPEVPDKRDIFSLTRTIENLWSAVLKSTVGIGRETVSEARKTAAKGILIVLLATGASVVPIVAKVPGGEWIETVFNYLKSVGVDPAKK
ncbi:MAG: hypothetical protein ACT6U0_17400 [Shinella sp.]|uniref:hypothetical protein n=1 Tax=Shinella sp. TaxID=1870904 RepID=UPI0040362E8B